jgi:phage-related protein
MITYSEEGRGIMFDVLFYRDRSGKEPVLEFIQELDKRKDKDSRIQINKIYDYIDFLRSVGTTAGEPYIKHLEGEIWEIRPIRSRILFAAWDGKSFILLHHFMKKTQKTPQREIDKAKRNLADYRERNKDDEQ